VQFHYTRLNGGPPEQRTVRPLALYCWSGTWTLAAWCEMRTDFRMFRLDHIATLQVLERQFEQKRGQRLQDYLRRVQEEMTRQKREGLDHWAKREPKEP